MLSDRAPMRQRENYCRGRTYNADLLRTRLATADAFHRVAMSRTTMLKNLLRSLWAVPLAAAAVTTAAFAADAPPPAPLQVAFVYVSPVGEAGWTYQHDQGRIAMEKALGAKVQTTFVESVAEGPDSERVIHDLAAQGNQLIFATSFGYLEPAL